MLTYRRRQIQTHGENNIFLQICIKELRLISKLSRFCLSGLSKTLYGLSKLSIMRINCYNQKNVLRGCFNNG